MRAVVGEMKLVCPDQNSAYYYDESSTITDSLESLKHIRVKNPTNQNIILNELQSIHLRRSMKSGAKLVYFLRLLPNR